MMIATNSRARVPAGWPVCALCFLLAMACLAGPAQAQLGRWSLPGRVVRPPSSLVRAEDAGQRMHTNHLILVPEGQSGEATPAAATGPQGLGPAEVWAAYGLPSLTSLTNAGSGVIAIVDANDYPSARDDFNAFSQQFGLPQET